MKKIYYHLFCTQNGELMHTGKNSESLDELKDSFLSYISVDFNEEEDLGEDYYRRIPMEELAEMREFDIRISIRKLDEESKNEDGLLNINYNQIKSLKEQGFDEQTIVKQIERGKTCNRCGNILFDSTIEDYKYQCMECDQDFYSFEQD